VLVVGDVVGDSVVGVPVVGLLVVGCDDGWLDNIVVDVQGSDGMWPVLLKTNFESALPVVCSPPVPST
jgi:hypothetical protein